MIEWINNASIDDLGNNNIEIDAANEIIDQNLFVIDNIDQECYIKKRLDLQNPLTSKESINEFTHEGYIVCAFPALFPTGNADFLQNRIHSITRFDYFKYLMQYKDGRFARDPRFRYFALNTIMRHSTILQSSLCTNDLKSKIIRLKI